MMISCDQLIADARQSITEVDVNHLHQRLAAPICLIDVREPGEFVTGHIAGAINMPRGVLEMQLGGHPALEGKAVGDVCIYLICRSGGRSALAAQSLEKMGIEKVYSVAGGMMAWQQAGLETA
jgi:rhodanese-related sulfurtransferase